MTTETQPQPSPYPAPTHQPPKKGMAIAAMVLGIVGVVLAFIPILGIVAFLLGGLAVILGIIALIRKRGKGQAITGIVTGIASFIIAGIVTALTGAFIGAVDESMQEASDELEALEEEIEEAAAESDEDIEADVDEIEEEVADEEEPAEEPSGEWAEVESLSGSGDQRGEVFTIEGDARITYEFNAADEDFAIGAVYLVAEGENLTDDGGIPETMLSGSESGDTMLYQTGSYYLDISAANYESWTVTIEEQQ